MNKIPKNIFGLFFVFSLILIGSFVFTNKASAATTYYVSTSGLDTNNGTSTSTPWAHHPWDLNATNTSLGTALQSDDTVIMKKGDVWWDCQLQAHDSGTSGHNIVTTSSDTFGSGSLPVCSGSPDTTSYNSGWIDDGGNVWHRTVTTEPKIVSYNEMILLVDTDITPTINKYYWTANVLYVNVGGDPASTMKWRVGSRSNPLYINSDYVTVKDISFEDGNNSVVGFVYINAKTGSILDGLSVSRGKIGITAVNMVNGEIKNCVVNNIRGNNGVWGFGIVASSPITSSIYGNEVTNAGVGVLVSGTPSGAIYVYQNKIHSIYNITGGSICGLWLATGVMGVYVYQNEIYDAGIVNSTVATGIFNQGDSNHIYSNKIYNVRYIGIILDNADLNNIYLNEIYNCGYKDVDGTTWIYYGAGGQGVGIFTSSSSEHNNVYRNYVHDNYQGIINNTVSGDGGNAYYYNIVTGSAVNGMGDGADSTTVGSDPILFYNNTIYHNPAVANTPAYRGHALYLQNSISGAGNAIFSNNLIYMAHAGTDTHGLWIQHNGTTAFVTSLKLDNNLIYAVEADSILASVFGTAYTTALSYRGVSGIQTLSTKITGLDGVQANAESHSVFTDPLFTSSSNFKLLPASPAINSGTDVSLTSDYLGNPIIGTLDIGAYEFQASTIPTSLSQYKADGTTTITSGDFTNEDSVVLKFNMSSSEYNSSDLLTPQVEIQELGIPFTDTVTNSGTAVAYSGTSVIGTVTVTGLTSGKTYHWQARTSNPATQSAWVSMGGSPDFQVDTTAPLTPIATPSTGTYNTTKSVTLTASGSDSIKYSTTETPADCSAGTLYTIPIEVSTTQTLYVRACDSLNNFSTASFAYVISRPSSSGSSASSRYNNLIAMGNTQAAQELAQQFPNQINSTISPTTTTTITSTPTFTHTLLRQGNKGEDIKTFQSYLNAKLNLILVVDGIFGPKTKQAVILFQKAKNLTPDGIVGPKTRAMMK